MPLMQRYRNLEGHSGVVAYEFGEDHIDVRFVNGDVYTYDWAVTGRGTVETMKVFAVLGRGLSTFISQQVRQRYARKRSSG